ncbi:1092_t:CDS:1, partial [Ambispora gerdemannii]
YSPSTGVRFKTSLRKIGTASAISDTNIPAATPNTMADGALKDND